MEIKGYKGFFIDKKNQNGESFEIGKVYTVEEGEVFFGSLGHGFHFCKNLEDCFNYFNPSYSVYAEVTGLGDIKVKNDETTDSFGICVSSSIRIDNFLSREEIVDMYLNPKKTLPYNSLMKFLKFFKLTEEEIEAFEEKYYQNYTFLETILYYQRNQEDTYRDKLKTYSRIKDIQEKYRNKEEKK